MSNKFSNPTTPLVLSMFLKGFVGVVHRKLDIAVHDLHCVSRSAAGAGLQHSGVLVYVVQAVGAHGLGNMNMTRPSQCGSLRL